jgi:hypothetical protein
VPLVIAYSFRFKSTTDPARHVGRARAADRTRILKVEKEHDSASTGIDPKLSKRKNHDLALGTET